MKVGQLLNSEALCSKSVVNKSLLHPPSALSRPSTQAWVRSALASLVLWVPLSVPSLSVLISCWVDRLFLHGHDVGSVAQYCFDCGVQHGWHWVTLDIDPISTLGRKGLRSFIVLWIWPKSEWTGRIGVKWYFYVCCTLRDKAVVGCWMEMLTVVWVSWWDIHHVGLRTGYFKPTQKIMNKLNVYTTAAKRRISETWRKN